MFESFLSVTGGKRVIFLVNLFFKLFYRNLKVSLFV